MLAAPEVIEEVPVVAEVEVLAAPEAVEEVPVVAEEATPATKSVKPSLLSPEQIAQRANEAKRHATLMAMQMDDLRKKQELAQKRLDDEAKKADESAAAAKKLSEGTLHKPAPKEGAKTEDKAAKKGNKNKEWADAENKKRGIKTRGDTGMNQGWRGQKN